jgi:hypothetical protein
MMKHPADAGGLRQSNDLYENRGIIQLGCPERPAHPGGTLSGILKPIILPVKTFENVTLRRVVETYEM